MLTLSNEIIQQILVLLAPVDLFNCCLACKRLDFCAKGYSLTRDLLTLGSYGYTVTHAAPWTRNSLSQFLSFRKNQCFSHSTASREHHPDLVQIEEWKLDRNQASIRFQSYMDGLLCQGLGSNKKMALMRSLKLSQLIPTRGSCQDGWNNEPTLNDERCLEYSIDELGYNAIGFGVSVKDNLLVVVQLTRSGKVIVHLYALCQYSKRWTHRVHPLASRPHLPYILPLKVRQTYTSKRGRRKRMKTWRNLADSLVANIRFGKDTIVVELRSRRNWEREGEGDVKPEILMWNWISGIEYPVSAQPEGNTASVLTML
ncbi:hypothetical protein CPB86DRAFT_790418, partial [Serendipita vermifera]